MITDDTRYIGRYLGWHAASHLPIYGATDRVIPSPDLVNDRLFGRYLGSHASSKLPVYGVEPCSPVLVDKRVIGRYLGSHASSKLPVYGVLRTPCFDPCEDCSPPNWIDVTIADVAGGWCGDGCLTRNGTYHLTRVTIPGDPQKYLYSNLVGAGSPCTDVDLIVAVTIWCDPDSDPPDWWIRAGLLYDTAVWTQEAIWYPRRVANNGSCETLAWDVAFGTPDEMINIDNDPPGSPICDQSAATLEIVGFG